uniref:Uncharacterized protein n=1 Tax=Rhizophora mucronata TaxID=61149 RepID=A0A2P2P3C7_RHIMU
MVVRYLREKILSLLFTNRILTIRVLKSSLFFGLLGSLFGCELQKRE